MDVAAMAWQYWWASWSLVWYLYMVGTCGKSEDI